MNQLKEVTFINSATLPFAQIDVAENTLFSGGNGAGKTTILRSILYFYGAGRSEHLGISRKKKRFEEYYFASSNSYLVYKFQNENTDVLAIVYKAGGLRVKYRFAIEKNCEDMKELFFDGNSALEPKELWSRLLEKEYELSPVLNSPKEYKAVLYGQDKKLQEYAFFSANTEYDQISKTLSNVFINSKLDSGSIKRSLVSSISGFEPIDLNQIRRNINDFRTKHDDISSFEKNSSYIYDAVSTLGMYEEQSQELYSQAKYLGANAKVAEDALELVKEKAQVAKDEILSLADEYEAKEKLHTQTHDDDLKEQGGLEKEIHEAKVKEEEYKNSDIKQKLVLWDKKPLLEEELNALHKQLSNLSDSQGTLSEKFAQMRESEEKSFYDKEQTLKRAITQLEQEYNAKNASLLQEQQEAFNQHRLKRDEQLHSLNQNLSTAKEESMKAMSAESIVQNKSFDKEKIEEARYEVNKATRAFDEARSELQLSQSQAEKIAEQIFSAEQSKGYKLQNLSYDHEKETHSLKTEIEELQRRKNHNASSLLGYMRSNDFEHTDILSALLKDEILYSESLSPSLKAGDGTLLGLDIDTSSLDLSVYSSNALNTTIQACEDRLKKMNAQYLYKEEELENETRNAINALRREQGRINTLIDEHLRHIPKLEQESLTKAEELQSLQNIASKKKDEELLALRAMRAQKDKDTLHAQMQYDAAFEALENELQEIRTLVKTKENDLNEEKSKRISVKNTELSTIKTECDKKLEQIKAEEDETLVQGGVDPSLLKKYQEELSAKEEELHSIEAYAELISEYKIDEKRIFSQLEQKVQRLNELSIQMEQKNKEFSMLKEDFESKRSALQKEKENFSSKVQHLHKDLKEYHAFKESALYTQLSTLIDNSDFEPNEQSLSDMINRLRDLGFEHASSKDKLRKKLNRAFSSISLHNIFNLYAPSSDTDSAIVASANGLKTFVLENKIETYKEQVAKEFTLTLRHLSSEIFELLKAEGDISKTVSRINKTLQDLQGIKVIRGIELRYKESDNLLLNTLKAIGELVEQNPYGNEINLFSAETNENFNHKALKYLDEMALHLSEEKADMLTLDESFVLEFRAIENGNDTGFVPSLDGIGSNGTDVMVKAMVNIAMLSLARKQSAKQEASVYFHCILDEVGILSPSYLKELIAYANNKKIRFVNGAPDEKLVSTYKRLYMLSTNAKHQTIVRKLVSQY